MIPLCAGGVDKDNNDNGKGLRDVIGRSHLPELTNQQQQAPLSRPMQLPLQLQQDQDQLLHTRPSFLSPRADKGKGKLKTCITAAAAIAQPQPKDTTTGTASFNPCSTSAPLPVGGSGKGPGGMPRELLLRRSHSFHPSSSSSSHSFSSSHSSISSSVEEEEEEDMVCGSFEVRSPRRGPGGHPPSIHRPPFRYPLRFIDPLSLPSSIHQPLLLTPFSYLLQLSPFLVLTPIYSLS